MVAGKLHAVGKVGAEVTPRGRGRGARIAALNALAAVAAEVGDIDAIVRIVKVVDLRGQRADFTGQAQVATAQPAAGDVFGDAGKPPGARSGVASLPLDAPVEVELVVAVAPAQPSTSHRHRSMSHSLDVLARFSRSAGAAGRSQLSRAPGAGPPIRRPRPAWSCSATQSGAWRPICCSGTPG